MRHPDCWLLLTFQYNNDKKKIKNIVFNLKNWESRFEVDQIGMTVTKTNDVALSIQRFICCIANSQAKKDSVPTYIRSYTLGCQQEVCDFLLLMNL